MNGPNYRERMGKAADGYWAARLAHDEERAAVIYEEMGKVEPDPSFLTEFVGWSWSIELDTPDEMRQSLYSPNPPRSQLSEWTMVQAWCEPPFRYVWVRFNGIVTWCEGTLSVSVYSDEGYGKAIMDAAATYGPRFLSEDLEGRDWVGEATTHPDVPLPRPAWRHDRIPARIPLRVADPLGSELTEGAWLYVPIAELEKVQ